jgi:RNA polymerase sigma-70 factor (sigma-E family)
MTSDDDGFREFVNARYLDLLRVAYHLTGSAHEAEDLVQTALVKTYVAWLRLDGIAAVEPYTRRVLVNTATAWWRRRWRGERPTGVLPERPVADGSEQRAERDRVWQLIQTLPARQRAVVVLRFYEDLSEAETARLLDISVGTVKSQTARAMEALRRQVGAVVAKGSQR